MANRHVNRRHVLCGLGMSGAVTLSYPSLAQTLVSQTAADANPSYRLFDEPQADALVALVNLVLPATESPGGVELGVPAFVDSQLLACHPQGEQAAVAALLDRLLAESFLSLPSNRQSELVAALERGDAPFNAAGSDSFRALKRLMVFGYFTSQVGATEVLVYQAIPGGYRGSIDYSSVGRTWGSLAFY